MNIQKLFSKATELGCHEILPGVYLHTQENIIADQVEWSDEDASKNRDFSDHPYWLTTGDGQIVGIDNSNDLKSNLQ